ncbi:MAG: glycosyl hydrolase family 17, partial [Ignavibacteria bacterium]|nr:glycosyl hydrolase family 17 [Ignavibacteria bacterium]
MKRAIYYLVLFFAVTLLVSCVENQKKDANLTDKTAAEILGNPEFQAISYGGYRQLSRDVQPTLPELKED